MMIDIFILVYIIFGFLFTIYNIDIIADQTEKYETNNKNLNYLRDGFIATMFILLWPIFVLLIVYSYIQIKRGKINA